MDFFSFQAAANQVITVTTSTAPGGNSIGTYLQLYDSSGNLVAEGYSLLGTTITQAGTYTLGVSGVPNYYYDPNTAGSGLSGDIGDYHLEMTLTTVVPDGIGETFATALDTKLGPKAGTYVMPNARFGDELYVSRDVDMYMFKAQKGQVFRAATSLPPEGAGGNVGLDPL